MKNRKTLTIIMAIGLILGTHHTFAQTAEELLPKAIQLEEVKGDLDNAIKTYQLILNKFPDIREVCAEALLRMGMCYEKMGNREAVKTYKRLVSNFPEQKNKVAIARERLARLTTSESPKEIAIKQVWSEGYGDFSISADGEYLTCIDVATGNLAFHNLKTGENKTVTHDGSYLDKDTIRYPEFSLISPDGKQVAYLWAKWFNGKPHYELRVIKVGNQNPGILYSCQEDELVSPELWLSDGKRIIVQKTKNRVWQLITINTTNGESHVLKENEYRSLWVNLSISPDEKYLAFDFPDTSGKGVNDIYLMSLDTRIESPLIENPANDRLIGWIPGRNELLFASNRSGTNDIWVASVSEDKLSGLPRRILTNIGEITPIGFTREGSLYYQLSLDKYESFIVPFDSENGKLSIDSRKPLPGLSFDVCWLPDGESLTCLQSILGTDNSRHTKLFVLNSKTGESRALGADLDFVAYQSRLSPDGKSILAFGWDNQKTSDKEYAGGIFNIDIKSGLPAEIKVKQNVTNSFRTEWDKTGKNIFYTSNNQIVKHNIVSAEEKIIYKSEQAYFLPDLRRSFNGNDLLFNILGEDYRGEEGFQMLSIPEDGGEIRTLCKYRVLDLRFNRITLSPDGKYIYFTAGDSGFKSVLCRIPSTGGKPETVWQSKDYMIAGISIHPRGKQIALSGWESGTEIRVIENLVQELEKLDKLP